MTVGASAEIAKRCPEHRLENWAAMLRDGGDAETIEHRAALICILNKGYELNRQYMEPGYTAEPLTAEAVLALPSEVFLALLNEALKATNPKREIETEPIKKNTVTAEKQV